MTDLLSTLMLANLSFDYDEYSNSLDIVYESYEDPILALLTSNEEISANTLQLVIRSLPVSDQPMIKYINRAHQIRGEMSRLLEEVNTGWEFMALEKTIDLTISNNNKRKTRLFDTSIAKAVSKKSLEFHQGIFDLGRDVDNINGMVSRFTPSQYISDAGVLLTNLSLRVIEMKAEIGEKINISYSKSQLIIMGSELETLLEEYNNTDGLINANHPMISNDLTSTIEGYKEFVVTILSQLKEAQQLQDKDEITECLAVIGDLEKMFEALMRQVSEATVLPPESHSTEVTLDLGTNFDNDTLYESEEDFDKKKSMLQSWGGSSSKSMSGNMGRTTLSEEMPYLLHAFESAKDAELELRQSLKENNEVDWTHHETKNTFAHKSAQVDVPANFGLSQPKLYNGFRPFGPQAISVGNPVVLKNMDKPRLGSQGIIVRHTKYGPTANSLPNKGVSLEEID